MKRKLKKKNCCKLTKLLHVADKADFYLADYIALCESMCDFKKSKRVRKKCKQVLDWDNKSEFLNKFIKVPILYKTKWGRVIHLKEYRLVRKESLC